MTIDRGTYRIELKDRRDGSWFVLAVRYSKREVRQYVDHYHLVFPESELQAIDAATLKPIRMDIL